MGGGPQNLNAMMRQAQKMQADMESKQQELQAKEYDISAGGGAVQIKINGKKVTTSKEVSQMVKNSKVGDSMVLTLRRGDAEIERTVVLEAIPDELNK